MERILLIDGYNIYYQHFAKNAAKDKNGEPIGGFVGCVNTIQQLAEKLKATKVIVVFDGVNAGFRRRNIYPGYKDKRGRKSRQLSLQLSDEQVIHLNNEDKQMYDLIETLQQLPVVLMTVPYYEADDVIAYLVKKYENDTTIVVSTDKDYLQLTENKNCFVYSPQKKILFDAKMVSEVYGLPIENFLYLRTIVGDSSDQLKGVKGLKQESLYHILPQITKEPIPSLEAFIHMIEELEDSKSKKQKQLKESKETVLLMYKLMKLTPDYISLTGSAIIDGLLKEQENKTFNKFRFLQFSNKNSLCNYMKPTYDIWARVFFFLNKQN